MSENIFRIENMSAFSDIEENECENVIINGSEFSIFTPNCSVQNIQIFPLPGYSLNEVTTDNSGRPVFDFQNERWSRSLENCKIYFENSWFVEKKYVPEYGSDEEEEEEEEHGPETVSVMGPLANFEDCLDTKTSSFGIHHYEFDKLVMEKHNGSSYIFSCNESRKPNKFDDNREDEKYNGNTIAILNEDNNGCSLQDGDCMNYVHYFKGHGLVLIQNCGDVCSCVLVYVPELDEGPGQPGLVGQ